MRRHVSILAVLAALTASGAHGVHGQTSLINLGAEYTASVTGDDFDGLEGGFGFKGGMLFLLSPMTHVGGEASWTSLDFESTIADDAADASLVDVMGVMALALGDGEEAHPYVDLRAGYGRLSFEVDGVDGSIDGPTAGAGLGVRVRPGNVWIDLHGRYQHHWFGEFDDDDLIFNEDISGGRFILGGGVSIPVGGR